MVIWVSLPGVVLHPLGPQNLGGMVLIGPKFCPQDPAKRQGKKLTCLWNHWAKWLSFSQKMIILDLLPGVVLTPP